MAAGATALVAKGSPPLGGGVVSVAGYPGREYIFINKSNLYFTNLSVLREIGFTVIVVKPDGDQNTAATRRFIDSFALVSAAANQRGEQLAYPLWSCGKKLTSGRGLLLLRTSPRRPAREFAASPPAEDREAFRPAAPWPWGFPNLSMRLPRCYFGQRDSGSLMGRDPAAHQVLHAYKMPQGCGDMPDVFLERVVQHHPDWFHRHRHQGGCRSTIPTGSSRRTPIVHSEE